MRGAVQLEIYGGKPTFRGIEQRFDLLVRQGHAAPTRVDGQFRVVEPEQVHADVPESAPKPQNLPARQKEIPACHDEVYVVRQTHGEQHEKHGDTHFGQKVEIVNEDVVRHLSGKAMTELIAEQALPRRVRGAVVSLEKRQSRIGKRASYTFPEDCQIVRIHAHPNDNARLRFLPSVEVPAHGGRFAISHWRDHGGQRVMGDLPQPLLQTLRYVDPRYVLALIPLRHIRLRLFVIYSIPEIP